MLCKLPSKITKSHFRKKVTNILEYILTLIDFLKILYFLPIKIHCLIRVNKIIERVTNYFTQTLYFVSSHIGHKLI